MQEGVSNMKVIFKGFFLLLAATAFFSTAYHLFFWDGPSALVAARPVRFSDSPVIIDAGHGGEDGGAISRAGTVESAINLAIASRLDTILGLYGVDVKMLRTEDISLHDASAESLRQKKSSDLHNRVSIIEGIPNPTLISIHQNSFSGGSKHHGAQVFYGSEKDSLPFAQFVQEKLRLSLDPENHRQTAKIPDTVYLMNHITCRAILVECGFLSNPVEDALLQTAGYQKKIAAALAGSYLAYPGTGGEESPQYEE